MKKETLLEIILGTIGELRKPYFYSVFVLEQYNKVFCELSREELEDTYRYTALKKVLSKLNN